MEYVTPTTFWSSTTIVASAIGAVFFLSVSHSSEPKHSGAAYESDVGRIRVNIERIETNQQHFMRRLEDQSGQLEELRRDQEIRRKEILDAIRNAPEN